MIKLRKLEIKDAEFMLEWMHNETISSNFQVDFLSYTLKDVKEFISNSFNEQAKHFAIVDENDIYLGTISLKNISKNNCNAEYAIVIRECAHGTGVAKKATELLFKVAFDELGLYKIYLNVLEDNIRANRFYDKMGFEFEGCAREHVKIGNQYKNLNWYGIRNREKN